MRISDWSSDVCSSDLPHRAQNMADLARPAATRAAERKGDMASIGHQAEAVHALAPDIEISVITAIRIAVERRSEERRVGNGVVSTGRSWWSPYHSKHKHIKYMLN